MRTQIVSFAMALTLTPLFGAMPSFQDTASPEGWKAAKGQIEEGNLLQSKGKTPLELQTTVPIPLPVEAIVVFRASSGDAISVQALGEEKGSKPLLEFKFAADRTEANKARVDVSASGEPMATVAKSARRGDFREIKTGWLNYHWRFPSVKALWDDQDYKEIGAGNAELAPFDEKVFTLRMVLTADSRQVWLDDRLVAEDRKANSGMGNWCIRLEKTAKVLSVTFAAPEEHGRFLPLALDNYSPLKRMQGAGAGCALAELNSMPMRVPKGGAPDINLGASLDRYRLSHGGGPDARYVSAFYGAWPDAFAIDPSLLTFRVPYRNYQNAWLLAWVDERTNTVAKGHFRFYQHMAGYPAGTDFEISPEAMQKGLVTQLPQKKGDGKQLYLIRVPLDTAGLYGMRDRFDQFMEFEISKPVASGRSYPDPIFYGSFPAGLPSSIHVVGITLEESPFAFQAETKQAYFVFEQPDKPVVTVPVTNTSDKTLDVDVRALTTSYDEAERSDVKAHVTVAPGATGKAELSFDLKKLGWHELKIAVEAAGVKREANLSLVVLPPDTRSRGDAVNENRFGIWSLEGHYTSLYTVKDGKGVLREGPNAWYKEVYRKLGLVEYGVGDRGTTGRNFSSWLAGSATDEEKKKAIAYELGHGSNLMARHAAPLYFYGPEWGIGSESLNYGPWPFYTGDGEKPLPEEVRESVGTRMEIYTAIGQAMHEKYPQVRRYLQWGSPIGTLAYLHMGISKDVVDGFGVDAPMFELLPETSNALGSINWLWMLRAEAKRLGWPRLPIGWMEGPFFPTCPDSLTERDQMDYQVRYLLLGMTYGIDYFISGVIPQDAGNFYGAEHYGAGIIHRFPLENPKPAVAAVATMTSMLCGADPIGGIDTGCFTTYCMEFQRAKDKAKIYAVWRVRGKEEARIKVRGNKATVTDAMGNAVEIPVKNGAIQIALSPSPVWLTGVEKVEGFAFDPPVYEDSPVKVTRPLAEMSAAKWEYSGSEEKEYAQNHFAVRRVTDPKLKAEFNQGEKGHEDAVAITLPVEPGDRPLANRYGTLKLKNPVTIPGKASALGIWIKGNSSWGRVVYQLRDAKGKIWTSLGTKNDWNCDDTHAWAYVNFEGWRYVRFPLPGSHPWDASRELETTWWGSRAVDAAAARQISVVDLPLTVEKIMVEARNEVPVLGEMKVVPERSYKLSHLVAEYESEADATPEAVARNQVRMPEPEWSGSSENPIARLIAEGVGKAPQINGFDEPVQEHDGRQMHIRFNADPALKYNLYVSRYADGRGADLIRAGVTDNQLVGGLRPEMKMYLFLTSIGTDKKESKPSAAFELMTHDKFLEK